VVWVRRMGLGWVARIMERAINSFLWGSVVWVFCMSCESCRRSCGLPYSYVFVVEVLVFGFWFFGVVLAVGGYFAYALGVFVWLFFFHVSIINIHVL
jgi:hypothetical protein